MKRKQKIQNIKNQDWETIQTPLHFSADHAFVYVRLPEGQETTQCLVKDDGNIIPNRLPDLEMERLILPRNQPTVYPKWSLASIMNFASEDPSTIAPNTLFEEVRNSIAQHIQLQNQRFYAYLALWNIGTYFAPLFNTYPYVYLNGPAQSGKTKTLTLCSCLSFNGQFTLHTNPTGIFRMIERNMSSLFIDEREDINNRLGNPDFRTMLLGGYKKGAMVQRMIRNNDAEDFEPRNYPTYSPKMIANINGIDDVLESRCITILMQRSNNRAITRTEIDIGNQNWQTIRDELFVFMMQNWKAVKKAYSEVEDVETIQGRDWELWRPILALAQIFGNGILTEMRELAVQIVAEKNLDNAESHENLLVEALLSTVEEDRWYRVVYIKEEFATYLEHGDWVSCQYIGKMLRRLGFTNKRRRNHGYEYYLTLTRVQQLAQDLGVSVDGEESEDSEAPPQIHMPQAEPVEAQPTAPIDQTGA